MMHVPISAVSDLVSNWTLMPTSILVEECLAGVVNFLRPTEHFGLAHIVIAVRFGG